MEAGVLSRDFVPHPPQKQALAHLYSKRRCALWMVMGGGKTVVTLTALDALDAVEPIFPVLVLAPLRVARSTWVEEIEKWAHLEHLRVSVITGTEQQRKRAVAVPADVYTLNYEQITWLIKELDGKWPFHVIVADELTRLRSFRLRQGGARAAALAKVAWLSKRFIGLTGTPAPNGIKNLWGQLWFVDKGERLGKSYTAFEMRWFRQKRDGHGIEPLDHAQAEIQDKLRDVCLTVVGAQVDEPITTPVYVDLIPSVRKLYTEMEKEAFTIIAEEGVEAVNAAVRLNKCLAAGTEVLTTSGWKPIEYVTRADMLWDGVEWVNACGSVAQGVQPVVDCWGVYMTPDHKVLAACGWREAEEVLRGEPTERPYRPDVRLPDGSVARGEQADARHERPSAMAGALRLRQRSGPGRATFAQSKKTARAFVRVLARRAFGQSTRLARYGWAPGVGVLAAHALALWKPLGQGLGQLRGPGRNGLRALGRISSFLGGHGAYLQNQPDVGAYGQFSWLQPGELPVAEPPQAGKQPQNQRAHPDTHGRDDRVAGGATLRSAGGHDLCADTQRLARMEATGEAVTFDILNAGPRHRFTVRGRNGEVFIAHNCLQIANGAMYLDDNGRWEKVHDAKLDALESIIEEANGASVLVAYNFKSDLARLRARFPKGRTLDANPDTIKQWNAGGIDLLFAHPASAGHGLNLQYGGNILVFFGVNWNLEEHQQIIERIGPQRQKQAGFDRPVFVYPILARGTVDELVMKRLEGKRSVQDILLEALKEKRR